MPAVKRVLGSLRVEVAKPRSTGGWGVCGGEML